jgi:hypothetical protein
MRYLNAKARGKNRVHQAELVDRPLARPSLQSVDWVLRKDVLEEALFIECPYYSAIHLDQRWQPYTIVKFIGQLLSRWFFLRGGEFFSEFQEVGETSRRSQ